MKQYDADWGYVGVTFREVEGGEWMRSEDVVRLLKSIRETLHLGAHDGCAGGCAACEAVRTIDATIARLDL